MFLNILDKNERKNFLELATIAIKTDGDMNASESAVFETYRMEMGIQEYILQNKDYDQLLTSFNVSSKKVKRAIMIELAGVLDADEEVNEIEQKWIKKIGADLGFSETEIRKMVRWAEDFNDLLKEGYIYINR